MYTVCNKFSFRANAARHFPDPVRRLSVALVVMALGLVPGCLANPTPHPVQDAGTLAYGGGVYGADAVQGRQGGDDDRSVDPAARPGKTADAVLGDSALDWVGQDAANGVGGGDSSEAQAEAGPAPAPAADADADAGAADAAGGEAGADDDDEAAVGAGAAPTSAFDGEPQVAE